jgi:hypothetical protein
MTLPKGYGPGGARGAGGRDDIEKMIGRRVENMTGIYILGFALCWAATAGGVYVGVTVIEGLGFFFIMKISKEKPIHA